MEWSPQAIAKKKSLELKARTKSSPIRCECLRIKHGGKSSC